MDKKPPDLVQNNDSFKAIKMSLNQFCNNKNLKARINDFVLNANKIMFEAYSLANIHIIRLINENKKIPKLNQSFFQHCCHYEMEKMSYNNIKINSVLRYKNNECRIVIDRDINGCKNIFNIFTKCLKGEEKPKEFCKGEILSNKKKIRATVKVGITSKKSKCLF